VLAARVAVTVQVPGAVALSKLLLEIEHPAVPAAVTAYDKTPPPEPPVAINVRAVPYVPEVEVSVRPDCVARATVLFKALEVEPE
jgi:hypothetical protein